ncbi:BON domain-containing protein [Paraburkholderia unamae]|uniref:BON domain-containing protein n=1 Tax=Paraburkholderia unamae TaxID=219649 RepID=UPI000DC25085|nr:BON domain-containing protein [Paraburkholderia unamae]RAR57545.1 BON domain-containing protein [Paraburkholderia unamae]
MNRMRSLTVAAVLMFAAGVATAQGGSPLTPESASEIIAATARNKQMVADVHAALGAAGIDTSKVKVRARDGVVTLSGRVADAAAVEAASSAAAEASGVTAVRNKLRPAH